MENDFANEHFALQKWHLCSDEEPPSGHLVIIRTKRHKSPLLGYRLGNEWFIPSYVRYDKVIAWHPIPPLPLDIHNLLHQRPT